VEPAADEPTAVEDAIPAAASEPSSEESVAAPVEAELPADEELSKKPAAGVDDTPGL
jgi:hypothetical protein